MPCYECLRADREAKQIKLNTLKPQFNEAAKAQGLEYYAAIETVNANPQWMWRPAGDEAIGRAIEGGRAVEFLLVN